LRPTPWRARSRRLRFGLSTLLGLKPRGFFIPYRHATTVGPIAYPALEPFFDQAQCRFRDVLADIERLAGVIAVLKGAAPEPRFNQSWFPRLDAAAAYAMVARVRPRRIVEIGSGHSTRFLLRAVRDQGLATEIFCIDPAPRASLAKLPVHWLGCLLQEAPREIFSGLGPSDILFVDSSHVMMPGSDVDLIVNDVLPRLPGGVLVHVHDIFLPDAYPPAWAWRAYNEQLARGALIQGGSWRLLFASRYIATRHPALLQQGVLARLPLAPDAFEVSLWLEKTTLL
jgi:predicted O-methyltransferase YrrM